MCNTKNNIENIATHRGIYRVWLQIHHNGTPELVSVWIDPAMRAFEAQMVAQEPALAGTLELSTDDEPPGRNAVDEDAFVLIGREVNLREFRTEDRLHDFNDSRGFLSWHAL